MRPILFLAVFLVANSVAAAETTIVALGPNASPLPAVAPKITGFIGAGAAVLPRFQGSDERLVLPIVLGRVDYNGMSAEIRGQGARFDLLPLKDWAFGPTVNVRLPRNDSAANAVISALPEIGRAVEVGGFVARNFVAANYRTGLTLDFEGRADVSGVHDGATFTLGARGYHVFSHGLMASIDTGLTYFDAHFADTYFSVSSDASAASGLARYQAKSGLGEASLAATLAYDIATHWRIIGRVAGSRLLGSSKDSPIVEREGSANGLFTALGVARTF